MLACSGILVGNYGKSSMVNVLKINRRAAEYETISEVLNTK